ncbi:MAG: molybdopterin-dependent oxidoreductase [Rhodothermales bacterium]
MPQITVDNRTYDFDGRPKLLQFCLDTGIELPHFCYHPAMSIPANCRQCLVEIGTPVRDRETGELKTDDEGNPVIQFFPKLMTSCSVDVTDGMVVKTHRSSELVERAQKDNLEFLLINHPLDCPICDQAGHCPLQIQTYKYGPEGSRFEFAKEHKPKRVTLGPRVMLDAERCINCTRCTRFTEEVSGSNQLTIIQRGVRNYPMTAPGTEFDEPYSMNTIDVCPVGALTSIDFRFRARIWEMSSTPSITVTNAKGSNCEYWVRDNLVLRVTPRQNSEVNQYWLPDEDRLNYGRFNDGRASGPSVRRDGELVAVTWNEAYDRVGELLQDAGSDVLFIGSAHAPVEDNYLLAHLAESVGAPAPVYIPHIVEGADDGWLITDDKTPNAQGCERLGIAPAEANSVRARIADGSVRLIYVLQDDAVSAGLFDEKDVRDIPVVVHPYHQDNRTLSVAEVSLPAAMVVETVGTYVSLDGRAQRVRPAKAVKEVNRMLMMEMGKSRIDSHGTPFDRWHNEENRVDCKPGWEVLPLVAQRIGLPFAVRPPRQVMDEIVEKVEAFSGVSYEAMGLVGVQLQELTMSA